MLNIILQCGIKSPINIIEGADGGPVTWLQFWGSYLAAVGSFAMAYVAYCQAIENQTDNQKTREIEAKRTEYESLKQDYEILERYVLDNAQLYKVSRFTYIGILCENKKYSEARREQEQLVSEFDCSTLYVPRFSSYIAKGDIKLEQYLSLLRRFNDMYLKYAIEVKECLSVNALAADALVAQLIDICNRVQNETNASQNLTNSGFDALLEQKNKMDEILQLCADLSK